MPELGRDDFREIVISPYRIIYRAERARIYIVAVRHARQRMKPADPAGLEP